jgi:hypothetical protein
MMLFVLCWAVMMPLLLGTLVALLLLAAHAHGVL